MIMWGVTGVNEQERVKKFNCSNEHILKSAEERMAKRQGELCFKSCQGLHALRCSTCPQVAHVKCKFPSMGAKRTAMMLEWQCESCINMETDADMVLKWKQPKGRAAELAARATELAGQALAPNSHETYASGVQAVDDFVQRELDIDPGKMWEGLDDRGKTGEELVECEIQREEFWRTLGLMVAAASYPTADGKKKWRWTHSSLVTYFNGGVATRLADYGMRGDDSPTKHWRLKKVLKGLRRRQGDEGFETKQATAMDVELLTAMVEELMGGNVPDMLGKGGTMSHFERRQAAIVLLLEFGGLARRSEMAGLIMQKWRILDDPWRTWDRGNIHVQWSGANYRRSKTDQDSRGQHSVVPMVMLGFPLGKWMFAHREELLAMGLKPTERMFRHVLKPATTAWASGGDAINVMIKRVVKHTLGVERRHLVRPDVDTYTSHCLRRGGAQYLRDEGISRDLIKLAGRWRSDAVDEYLNGATLLTREVMADTFVRSWAERSNERQAERSNERQAERSNERQAERSNERQE
jgi:hypothetical protein